MSNRIQCPSCSAPLLAPPEMAGQVVPCPKCGGQVTIPMAGGAMQQPMPGQQMPGQQMPGQQPSPFANFQAPAFGQPAAAPRSSGGGMNKGLLIGLIAGGVVLLGVMGLVVWSMVGGGPSAAGSDLTYLPDNCFMYGKVRVNEVTKTGLWKQIAANFPGGAMQEQNMDPEAVESLVIGVVRPARQGQQAEFTMVIRGVAGRKLTVNLPDTPGAQQREETIAGRKATVVQAQNQTQALCTIDDQTVLGGSLGAVRAVLERGGETTLSAELRAVMDKTDFSQHFAVAVDMTNLDHLMNNDNAGAGGGIKIPGMDPQELIKKIKGAILEGNVSSDVRLSAKAVCTDEQAAKQIEGFITTMKALGGAFMGQDPNAKRVFDSLKVASSADTVTLSITISGQVLTQMQPGGSGGNRPPPGTFPGKNPGFPGTRPTTPGKKAGPSKVPFGFE